MSRLAPTENKRNVFEMMNPNKFLTMPTHIPLKTVIAIAASCLLLGIFSAAVACSRTQPMGRVVGIGQQAVEVVLVSGEKLTYKHATEWHRDGVLMVDTSTCTTCFPLAQVQRWSSSDEPR